MSLVVDRVTGAGLSALMEACLSVEKPNGTVGPIVLAAVINMAPRKLAPGTAATEKVTGGKCERTLVTEEESKDVELLDHECERRGGG